ncbi:MAG: hypothetical protein AB1489_22815 [Acidobacteriota bacterium]
MKTPRLTNPRTQYIIATDPPPAPTGRLRLPVVAQEQQKSAGLATNASINTIENIEQSKDAKGAKKQRSLLRWFWERFG